MRRAASSRPRRWGMETTTDFDIDWLPFEQPLIWRLLGRLVARVSEAKPGNAVPGSRISLSLMRATTDGCCPMMKREPIPIAKIYVPAKRRGTLDPKKAQEIAESI